MPRNRGSQESRDFEADSGLSQAKASTLFWARNLYDALLFSWPLERLLEFDSIDRDFTTKRPGLVALARSCPVFIRFLRRETSAEPSMLLFFEHSDGASQRPAERQSLGPSRVPRLITETDPRCKVTDAFGTAELQEAEVQRSAHLATRSVTLATRIVLESTPMEEEREFPRW